MTKTEQFTLVANHNPNLYCAFPIEDGGKVIDLALWPVIAWAACTEIGGKGAQAEFFTIATPVHADGCESDVGWHVVDLVSGIWTSRFNGQGTGGVEGLKRLFQARTDDRTEHAA